MNRLPLKSVLVATNHLNSIGGSEVYTFYLIKALTRQNQIQIEYFTFEKGVVSDKIEKELEVRFKSNNRYDLIIANHNSTVNYLYGQGPILQICHGTLPALEQPSPLAMYHIAVSEEVARHLQHLEFPSTVILNGIDIETFRPHRPLNLKPARVLSLCHSNEANSLISEVCDLENLELESFNKFKNPTFTIYQQINEADLVIGIGRSVYDAMACGRTCIIFDHRDYNGNLGDGYLYPSQFNSFAQFNCSGRYRKKSFSKTDLIEEIRKYNPKDGEELRQIALQQLNMEANANKLLKIGEKFTLRKRILHRMRTILNFPKIQPLFKEQKRLFREKLFQMYIMGTPKNDLNKLIQQEKFPLSTQLSLYFFLLKLKKKLR